MRVDGSGRARGNLSGDIRLGYLGQDGGGTGLFRKCDTTSSSFLSYI